MSEEVLIIASALKKKKTTFQINQTNYLKTVLSRVISSLHSRCLSI